MRQLFCDGHCWEQTTTEARFTTELQRKKNIPRLLIITAIWLLGLPGFFASLFSIQKYLEGDSLTPALVIPVQLKVLYALICKYCAFISVTSAHVKGIPGRDVLTARHLERNTKDSNKIQHFTLWLFLLLVQQNKQMSFRWKLEEEGIAKTIPKILLMANDPLGDGQWRHLYLQSLDWRNVLSYLNIRIFCFEIFLLVPCHMLPR